MGTDAVRQNMYETELRMAVPTFLRMEINSFALKARPVNISTF